MPLPYAHHTTGSLLELLNGISLVVFVSTMVVFQPKHTCTQQKLPTRPAALRRSGSRPLLIPSIWLRYATTKTKLSKASSKGLDRKSTRLNSSHVAISYAVFFFNNKKITNNH